MSQVMLTRCRSFAPASAPPVQPRPFGNGPSSEPHITMAAECPATGHAAAGVLFFVAGAGGSYATIYARDAATGVWAELASWTGTAFGVFRWFPVPGLPPAELYVATDAGPIGQVPAVVFLAEGSL